MLEDMAEWGVPLPAGGVGEWAAQYTAGLNVNSDQTRTRQEVTNTLAARHQP